MSKKILITGAAGFIGSHLTERLLDLGHSVVGVDSLDKFYPATIKLNNLKKAVASQRFEFIEADILDQEKMQKLFAATGEWSAIYHLAARAGVRPSLENPMLYMKVNIEGTALLLELARKLKVPHFILASSSSIYGNSAEIPFRQDELRLNPISPYGVSKLAAEKLCYTFSENYKLPITALRFFTVYGPRQRPDLAIHKFTEKISLGHPIEMFGDGTSSRDYTFISDIVDGMTQVLGLPFKDLSIPFRVYNLGSRHPITLKELIGTIEEVVGKKAQIKRLPAQSGDVDRTFADISKSLLDFGYAPKKDFKSGIAEFWEWYQEKNRN